MLQEKPPPYKAVPLGRVRIPDNLIDGSESGIGSLRVNAEVAGIMRTCLIRIRRRHVTAHRNGCSDSRVAKLNPSKNP
jgi:hypothetical protein